jgi:hypothetical protein
MKPMFYFTGAAKNTVNFAEFKKAAGSLLANDNTLVDGDNYAHVETADGNVIGLVAYGKNQITEGMLKAVGSIASSQLKEKVEPKKFSVNIAFVKKSHEDPPMLPQGVEDEEPKEKSKGAPEKPEEKEPKTPSVKNGGETAEFEREADEPASTAQAFPTTGTVEKTAEPSPESIIEQREMGGEIREATGPEDSSTSVNMPMYPKPPDMKEKIGLDPNKYTTENMVKVLSDFIYKEIHGTKVDGINLAEYIKQHGWEGTLTNEDVKVRQATRDLRGKILERFNQFTPEQQEAFKTAYKSNLSQWLMRGPLNIQAKLRRKSMVKNEVGIIWFAKYPKAASATPESLVFYANPINLMLKTASGQINAADIAATFHGEGAEQRALKTAKSLVKKYPEITFNHHCENDKGKVEGAKDVKEDRVISEDAGKEVDPKVEAAGKEVDKPVAEMAQGEVVDKKVVAAGKPDFLKKECKECKKDPCICKKKKEVPSRDIKS